MTMSTSSAPLARASAASCALVAAWWAPDGNPTTAAVRIPAGSQPLPSGSSEGDTQTAFTANDVASRQSWWTSSAVASGARRVWSIIAATAARSAAGSGRAAVAARSDAAMGAILPRWAAWTSPSSTTRSSPSA